MEADACGHGHSCTGGVHWSVVSFRDIFPVDCAFLVPVSAQGSLLCPNGVWDLRVHNRHLAVHIPFRNFASKVSFCLVPANHAC